MLETMRCFIRPFQDEDLDTFIEYRNDEAWMRFQGFKGLERDEYAKRLLADAPISQGKQYAIISKATKALLGDLYLRQENSILWIGYTIHPHYARHGFAYEVANAACVWAAQNQMKVKASVMPNNIASIRLLEKLGLVFVGVDEYGDYVYEQVVS